VKFLIDAQLPPALVQLLEGAGCEAEHVIDKGMESCMEAPRKIIIVTNWLEELKQQAPAD